MRRLPRAWGRRRFTRRDFRLDKALQIYWRAQNYAAEWRRVTACSGEVTQTLTGCE